MTRDEAIAQCAELKATHEDRATHQWLPRETPDADWQIVKVALPATSVTNTTPEQRADEKPPTGDDPRTSLDRNLGGPWVPGL